MRGRREERIEAAVDHGAAALLAVALAAVSFPLAGTGQPYSTRAIIAAACAVFAYLLTSRLLRSIGGEARRFSIASFDLPPLELQAALDELVLTDADRLVPEPDELVLTDADRLLPQADELILKDILAEIGPDSRVVRLFDPAGMPTPAQLNARIQNHLAVPPAQAAPADESQALFEALSELRRSLR